VRQGKLLSQRHVLMYFIAVWIKRLRRYYDWHFDGRNYAHKFSNDKLPFQIKEHQSVLLKKLGESDMQLQVNKVANLKIAIKNIDGILIRPGETFSFCKLVGLQTKQKGYLEGMSCHLVK
jgi:vancomycin resistance protein VanW